MEVGYGTLKATLEPDCEGYEPAETVSDDNLIQPEEIKPKKKYPFSVFFILSNEFCERFSYYGMRAILVLYLTRWLQFEENQATSIFHAFSMLCYLMPVLGAVIADGYLGRYRTILYLSCLYFVGNLILAMTALPPPEWIGPSIGLFLIACGTGGIKASVAPFGADQFSVGMEKWQNSFFSAFYFMINLGSMISMLVTPVLRADVSCFGHDCYILAFGLPAVLMLLSVLLFFFGRKSYKMVPPTGNVIGKTFKCIYYGLKGKMCGGKYEETRSHWLYYADDKYDPAFIEDVRLLLKVLLMFLPLPIFWALSDQQGSRWTLQAEHMDGDLGIFGTLKPDQMQALNPILILVLIPLFDKVIYPILDKCRIPNRPLQRMVVGLYISSIAFVCAGLVQIKIDNAEAPMLSSGETGVTFINTLPCSVQIKSPFYSGNIPTLQMSEFLVRSPGKYLIQVSAMCVPGQTLGAHTNLTFQEGEAYRLIAFENDQKRLRLKKFDDKRTKPKHGDAALSIFSTVDLESDHVTLVTSSYSRLVTESIGTHFNISRYVATEFKELGPALLCMTYPVILLEEDLIMDLSKTTVILWVAGKLSHIPDKLSLTELGWDTWPQQERYSLYTADQSLTAWTHLGVKITLGTGGVYTAVLSGTEEQPHLKLFTDVHENTVSMVWMVPQYLIITIGEVLFSISGLSFAYSQAPTSLKSVVQAIWLLTVSFGDLVVIIVANIHAIPSQMSEFFLFALLMFLDSVIFMIMSMFYTYKPNSLYTEISDAADIPVDSTDTTPIVGNLGEEFPLQMKKLD